MVKFNKTHLSIDQAESRGFIHRDYIAHCLRWTYAVKRLGPKVKTAKILDVGCGKEIPFAKTLYTSKMSPTEGLYVAVDINQFDIPKVLTEAVKSNKFPLKIFPTVDVSSPLFLKSIGKEKFSFVICFEVLEHMPPTQVILTLANIRSVCSNDSVCLFSTPNYDASVGAAANHPNEMQISLVQQALNNSGFNVDAMYGTFASIKDYKDVLSPAELVLFERLREYYDSNYLATVFAPLFPALSRNVLYVCSIGDEKFFSLSWDKSLSNNNDWEQILGK